MEHHKTESASQYSSSGTGGDLIISSGDENNVSPQTMGQPSSSGYSSEVKPLLSSDVKLNRRKHIQSRLREIRDLVSNCSEIISQKHDRPPSDNPNSGSSAPLKPSCSGVNEGYDSMHPAEKKHSAGGLTSSTPPSSAADNRKLGTFEALGLVLQYIRRHDGRLLPPSCSSTSGPQGGVGNKRAITEKGEWDVVDNQESFAGYGMDEVEAVNYTLELDVSLPAGQVTKVSGCPEPFGFNTSDLHGRFLTELVDQRDYCLLLHCCLQPDTAKRCVFARLKSPSGLVTRCQLQFWSVHSVLHVWISSAETIYKCPKVGRSFSSRHSSLCHIKHISPGTVYTTGYLPQDLVGKSLFLLAHSDDIEALKDAHYLVIQAKGKPVKSKHWRFKNADGLFLTLETEWSYFQNPWSKRVEFVIGRHKVVSEHSATIAKPSSLNLDLIKQIEEEICKLLTKHHAWPSYHSKHSIDSVGSPCTKVKSVAPIIGATPVGAVCSAEIGAKQLQSASDSKPAITTSCETTGISSIVVTPISPPDAPENTADPKIIATTSYPSSHPPNHPVTNSVPVPVNKDNTAASYLDELIEDCVNNNNNNNNNINNNNNNNNNDRSKVSLSGHPIQNIHHQQHHQQQHSQPQQQQQQQRFIGANLFSAAMKNCGGEMSAWSMLQNYAAKLHQNSQGCSAGSSPDSFHSGPTYSQIIRNENIERYFESNPKTHSSDESSSDKPKSASQSPEHEIERSVSTMSMPLTSELLQRHEDAFRISWKRRRASMFDEAAHTADAPSVVTPSKIHRRTSSFPRPASIPVMKEQHLLTTPPPPNFAFVRPVHCRAPSNKLDNTNTMASHPPCKWGAGPVNNLDQSDASILVDQRNSQSMISSSSSSMDVTSIRTPHYHITTAPLPKTRVYSSANVTPLSTAADRNSPIPQHAAVVSSASNSHCPARYKNSGTTISFVTTPTCKGPPVPPLGPDSSNIGDSKANIPPMLNQAPGSLIGVNQRDLTIRSPVNRPCDRLLHSGHHSVKKPTPYLPRLVNHGGCPLPPDILYRYQIPTPPDPRAVLAKDREFLEAIGPLNQKSIPNQQLEKLYANEPQPMSFNDGYEKSPVREVAQALLLLEEN